MSVISGLWPLEKDFDSLLAGYLENTIGISDHFLNPELLRQLRENLLLVYGQKLLAAAGTGNAEKLSHNTQVRSDSIYWLDRSHAVECEQLFFDRIEDFIRYLNTTCYAGITGCEFHYSLYQAGSFYEKHVDQFKENGKRQFSMITYLNPQWEERDGGQLLVELETGEQMISPTYGKTVFFKSSDLQHQVLVTHASRLSVTGWLKRE